MRPRSADFICLLLVMGSATCAAAGAEKDEGTAAAVTPGVSVEKVTFQGWTNAWRLSNRACELIVVPQLSRVMYFGLKGGSNLLWVAPSANGQEYAGPGGEWRNLGGDKIWPEPQAVFGWPPPYFFDNAPSDAEAIAGGVRLKTRAVAPRLGCVCVREFTLDADAARVSIRQCFEKSAGEPLALTLWNVTQVCTPTYSLLPLGPADGAKPRYREFEPGKIKAQDIQLGETVLALRPSAQGAKVGVSPLADGSNGWVAAVYPACMLVEARTIQKAPEYPDANCHAEVYCATPEHGAYVELELLSPLKTLKSGETLRDDMVWQIVPLTEAQARDPEQAAAAARTAHATELQLPAR